MDTENHREGFTYTYSAKEQEELKKIRQKYMPPEENKMEQIRRLDASVTRKGTIASLAAGIAGALILGTGMCCCMVWGGFLFIPGIILGIAGILLTAAAYPIYNRVVKKEREKIAPEIMRLTEELMK
ncbi:MAG TPA: hypothetical protein H9740_02395 [Candidatus Hungatella pullicola]|nr:hypothetical protein [Candidatus Hungatella pullicola]